jgi:hypothetical protein
MGLIQEQDRRPRDWAYKVAFDRKDLPSLQQMIKEINENHDADIIEDFNSRCEQKLNSSSSAEKVELENGIEIQSVTKSEDLVVNGGLVQCINLILGTNSTRWRYIAVGDLTVAAPTITDTALADATIVSVDMAADNGGWREAVGMKLFFGAICSETRTIASIREMGVFNGLAGSTMLNRQVFNNNPPIRIQGYNLLSVIYRQVFILSSVVQFCPVA